MTKNYPINMKIPSTHIQIVSNEYTNFQKNPCTHLLEHVWTKSCPQTEGRVKPIYPQTSFAGDGGL